jgi:hypothetical protein
MARLDAPDDQPPAAPSPGTVGAALGGLWADKTHARSRAPDHCYYAQGKDRKNSKRAAALSESRKIIRQGLPHPDRARPRRARHPLAMTVSPVTR